MRTLPSNHVDIAWSEEVKHYVALCSNCLDHADAYSSGYGWLVDWAESHRCDPERAELLAAVLAGVVA